MSDLRCDYSSMRTFIPPASSPRLRRTQSHTPNNSIGPNQRPTTFYNTCYSSKNRPKDGLLPSPRIPFNRMYSHTHIQIPVPSCDIGRSRSPSPAPQIHFTPHPHPHELPLSVKRDATSSAPCGTTATSVPVKGFQSQLMFANYPLVCGLVPTVHPLSLTTPCPSEPPAHPHSAAVDLSARILSQKRLSKSLMPEFRDGSHSPELSHPDLKRGYRINAADSDYENCSSSTAGLHSPVDTQQDMETASVSERSSGCSSPSVESDSDSAINGTTRDAGSNRSLSYKTESEHFFTSSSSSISSSSSSNSSSPEPSEYPREDTLFIDNSKLPNTPRRSSPVSSPYSSHAYQLSHSLKRHSSSSPPVLPLNRTGYCAQESRHSYSQPHNNGYRHNNGLQRRRPAGTNHRDLHSKVYNYSYYGDSSFILLDAEMWKNSVECKQDDIVYISKLNYCKKLTACIEELFEGVQFCMVGSSMNGFSTSDSDLDLCMMMPNHPTPTRQDAIERLCKVSYKLRDKKIGQKHQVISAKTPIIKFSDPQSGFEVDISVNNQHGIRNTHLLHTYSQLDHRVRPLVVFIKQWAKKQNICNARMGTLSSYSLTLMVIFYLQSGCSPAVLPSLQELSPEYFDSWEMFPTDQSEQTQIKWRSANLQNLADLLLGFFRFYSEFDYQNVMSIRTASVIAPSYDQLGFIRIEEPYTRENVAHSVSRPWSFTNIKSHIQNAYLAICSTDVSTLEALYNIRPAATIPSSFTMNYYS